MSINQASITAEPAQSLLYWKKLLHFGDKHSQVVSKEFFLSPVGNTDYLAELNKTIELLNSQQGEAIACNFPARYQWLVKTGKAIPIFDLGHCPELNAFKQGFQQQTLSVAFASEYLDNPVSSFGHVMLVFHDKDKPLLSADTVHFAARTDQADGFFTYAWKGLTGGYPGYFFRDPFFKKQYQYNIIEQRYVHLYTLDFSAAQIEKIIYHLYELRKATFNYYFINENCAYQIGDLLDIAGEDVSFSDAGFVLPVEIVTTHKQHYKAKTVLYPSAAKVRYLLKIMSPAEQARFEAVVVGDRLPSNTLSNKVKYALTTYYEYDFKKNHIANANYDQVMRLHYVKPALNIETPEPLDRPGFSRLSAGYMKTEQGESVLLSYRPFLLDLFDIQQVQQQAAELSLFTPIIRIEDNTTSLYRLDLISIKSLPARNRYFKPISWQFYTGFNRDNPAEDLDYETEFGLGLTNKLSFLTLSYAVNAGIDVSTGEYYYKPNATLLVRLGDHLKIGLNAFEKYYKDKQYIERNAFVSLGSGNYAVNASYSSRTSGSDEVWLLSVYKYFN